MRSARLARAASTLLLLGVVLGGGVGGAGGGRPVEPPLEPAHLAAHLDWARGAFRFVAWAKDGRWLMYQARDPRTGRTAYWVASPFSGRRSPVLDPVELAARLSARGGRSAAAARRGDGLDLVDVSADLGRVLVRMDGQLWEVGLLAGSPVRLTAGTDPVRAARYSPDGRRVFFTRGGDAWVLDRADGRFRALTAGGSESRTHGLSDWLLAEEFGQTEGAWWSPDGRYLALLRLDFTGVPRRSVPDPPDPVSPGQWMWYPRPGDPNPTAALLVADLDRQRLIEVDLGGPSDAYLPRVAWAARGRRLAVQVLDRDQRRLRLLLVEPDSGRVTPVLEEHHPGWVAVDDLLYLFRDRDELLWGSERDGHRHLYRYDFQGRLLGRVTSGAWSVTRLNAVDEVRERVYLTGTLAGPQERHLAVVRLSGGPPERLTTRPGTHRVEIAPDGRSFAATFSDDLTPPETRVGRLPALPGTHLIDAPLPAEVAGWGLRPWVEVIVPALDGTPLPARVLWPAGVGPGHPAPAVVHVYGGPLAQVTAREWSPDVQLWHQLLARRGYVVFCLDGRGGAGRGRAWEDPLRGRLDRQPWLDQWAGLIWLRGRPEVDPGRVGVWGWSFGGTMACLMAARAPGAIRAAAAVAPVTDWREYDSAYTERYLGLPADNPAGYVLGSPLVEAGRIRSPLLLLHGAADPNVHARHSLRLAETLTGMGRPPDIHLYPGMDHAIRGRAERLDLYRRLLAHFDRHLGPAAGGG